MLRHHSPTKSSHRIKKKKNFAGHVLCQFVTQPWVHIYCKNGDCLYLTDTHR